MRFDLHIHSNHSQDSLSGVKSIMDHAINVGLQGIAITDHNSFAGSEEALQLQPENLIIIPGAEYSTDQGHMLVYFLKEGLENKRLSRDTKGCFRWQEIIEHAHAQKALVFLAHPFKHTLVRTSEVWDAVDGLEVYNSRTSLCRNPFANTQSLEKVRTLRKGFSAGSDGHWLHEIGHAFWEYIPGNLSSSDTIIHANPNLQEIRLAMESGKGRVWGKASHRLFEPASQIISHCRKGTFYKLPRPLLKGCYSLCKECQRLIGLESKPLEGWVYDSEQENRKDVGNDPL